MIFERIAKQHHATFSSVLQQDAVGIDFWFSGKLPVSANWQINPRFQNQSHHFFFASALLATL